MLAGNSLSLNKTFVLFGLVVVAMTLVAVFATMPQAGRLAWRAAPATSSRFPSIKATASAASSIGASATTDAPDRRPHQRSVTRPSRFSSVR